MFRRQYIVKAALTCAFIALLTPTAHADFASSQRWFNSMDEEDRSLLQSDLMLLGHYNALADSTFGNFTYRAIQAFQSSIGQSPTGVLTQRQEDLLRDSSTALYHELGFEIVEDARGRMAMLLPQKLLPSVSETRRGTAYTSADGSIRLETIRKPFADESYESLYRSLAASSATRKVSYNVLNSDKFVVSGTREDKLFYILINNTPGESAGFSVEWERSSNQVGAMVATFMASYSYPLAFAQPNSSSTVATHQPQVTPQPTPQASPPPAPPAPQSSSGTGFFVAENGVLVTNHHVIEVCSAIDVAGYGPARLITSDEDVDLAVLQLRTTKAHPVAEIRAEAAQLGESVVALGFPLADILNSSLNMGTGIVSSETGFFGDETRFTTNVGIQPGNSGGPILDEYGRVLGVAVSKINDEALLAAMGTTAPNVGFAIKGEVVADYLSLFRLPEPSPEPEKPLSARELAELGRNFTVQVTCDIEQSAHSGVPTQTPVATNSISRHCHPAIGGLSWPAQAQSQDYPIFHVQLRQPQPASCCPKAAASLWSRVHLRRALRRRYWPTGCVTQPFPMMLILVRETASSPSLTGSDNLPKERPSISFSYSAVERHIRRSHPGCPDFAVAYMAQEISQRKWEGVSLGRAVGITMDGILRHRMTDYDTLLLTGMDRKEARKRVQPKVQALLEVWAKPRPLHDDKSD